MEASGQTCPPGYTQTSIFLTVDYGSGNVCNYTIVACYICGPTGPNPHTMQIKTISSSYGCAIPFGDPFLFPIFQDALFDAMRTKWFDQCSKVPCGIGSKIEKTVYPVCAKLINDPTNMMILVEFCEDNDRRCVLEEEVCYDYSGGGTPFPVVINSTWYSTGIDFCPTAFPQMPPIGFDINDEWETECFEFFICPN